MAQGNPVAPFGAILVDRHADEIVAEGLNRTHENPTWHGEIDVINQYALRESQPDWSLLDLYSTAEPCPLCQAAIIWSGIGRVFFGTSIRRLQQLGWNQIDILSEEVARRAPFATCEIVGGVLESECDRLFRNAFAEHKSRSDGPR